MAGKVNNKMSVVVACLVALIQISSSLAATTWKVGESAGWTNSGAVNYSSWASGKAFAVGDTLNFNFVSGAHTVTVVSESDYDSCTSSSPISSTGTSPANFKLTSGNHYYICSFQGHCEAGQKLAITVGSSSTPSATSPSSSTTPSTTPSATTPSTSTTSPPPPPSSSGVVVGAGFVMPFLIGAAAFLM